MAISVTSELHVFLLSLIGGALTGVFFDLFRTLRRLVKSSTVFVGVQDMVFWLFFACAAFFFMYRVNYGQPRWYIFCGILLGALLYHLIFRDHMVRFFTALANGFFLFCRFVFRMLLFPLIILCRALRPIFRFWGRILHSLKRKIYGKWEHFWCGIKKFKKRRKMY